MRVALYQPDIPQNTGTILRLGACLGVGIDIIEPCGFVLSDKRMRRAGMDYLALANFKTHLSWKMFFKLSHKNGNRLVLLSPDAPQIYTDFQYTAHDILVLGQESIGVPESVRKAIEHQIKIPMTPKCRSLNIAITGAMVLGESLRQLELLPKE
jgi:tRNA (cytidine/uridine-2'-O-)-methyltransferase